MDTTRRTAATQLLRRFVEAYNQHDAESCAQCYAENATLWDQSWNETHEGRQSIRNHYAQEFTASPDIEITIRATFESDDSLCTEMVVRGTHDGDWRGLPATGNRFEISSWTALRVTAEGSQIVDSRFEYDRATVFHQIGVLHDPSSLLGKALTVLSHPVTMARAAKKRISVRPTPAH